MKLSNSLTYIPLSVASALAIASCSNDGIDVQDKPDVHYCVRAEWHNGRGEATRSVSDTRAVSSDIINTVLATGTSTIGYYPDNLTFKYGEGSSQSFELTKSTKSCTEHDGIFYSSTETLPDDVSSFTFLAVTSGDGEEFTCEVRSDNPDHVNFKLTHTQALLRFAFKVSEKYDKIRYIKVKGIKLNNTECPLVDKVLNKDDVTLIAYGFVNPSVANHTLACTYDIYDKDAKFDGTMDETTLNTHITRKGVTATNSFTMNNIKDASNNKVSIQAGFYYDLNITLNPDYLYVLSDHDNKHMTIN